MATTQYPVVLTAAVRKDMIEALVAEDGPLDGAKVMLLTSDVFTNVTAVSQITEANFTGYAASAALVWGTPFYRQDGKPAVAATSVQFTSTGSAQASVVTGYAIVNADKSQVFAVQRFDASITITQADEAIIVLPQIAYGN